MKIETRTVHWTKSVVNLKGKLIMIKSSSGSLKALSSCVCKKLAHKTVEGKRMIASLPEPPAAFNFGGGLSSETVILG